MTAAGTAAGAAATRVFIVDDHAMVRAGVRAELGTAVHVVGEAADVATAVEGIRAATPDVVLLDVHLPGGGGRAVLAALHAELPATRWLALSVSDAAEDVIAVIRAGARGYVTKTISGPDLRAAVQRVADGDVVFSPRLAGFVLDAFAAAAAPAAPAPVAEDPATDPGLDLLSAREREVMQLLARGYTYREIGGRLFISVKTVESHASNVLRKLQLSNRNELTRWAATNRLL
ncbi:response regulator [Modestobacter lapidis]|nr:response regulator transcription factor [Modestobacter lapidis]